MLDATKTLLVGALAGAAAATIAFKLSASTTAPKSAAAAAEKDKPAASSTDAVRAGRSYTVALLRCPRVLASTAGIYGPCL